MAISLNTLPEEVILIIFSYLSLRERIGVQRVCKTWLRLSLDGVGCISFFGEDVSYLPVSRLSHGLKRYKTALDVYDWQQIFNVLKRCGGQISLIEFYGCDFENKMFIEDTSLVISSFLNLKLHIFGSRLFNISDFIKLTNKCCNIEELGIFAGLGNCSQSIDPILKQNNIKVLRFYGHPMVFDPNLLPKLRELSLFQLRTSEEPKDLLRSLYERSGQSLRILKVEIPMISHKPLNFDISHFSMLKELNVGITGYEFPDLNLENLEILNIRSNANFNKLLFICRNRRLRSLTIRVPNCDYLISEICKHCVEIEWLDFGYADLTKDLIKSLSNLNRLEYLRFLGRSQVIDDTSFAVFIHKCKYLRILEIENIDTHQMKQTLDEFVKKARLNVSQKFFINVYKFNVINKEIPPNLYWKMDPYEKCVSCSQSISNYQWEHLFYHYFRQVSFVW